jgi:hypothetical protein
MRKREREGGVGVEGGTSLRAGLCGVVRKEGRDGFSIRAWERSKGNMVRNYTERSRRHGDSKTKKDNPYLFSFCPINISIIRTIFYLPVSILCFQRGRMTKRIFKKKNHKKCW